MMTRRYSCWPLLLLTGTLALPTLAQETARQPGEPFPVIEPFDSGYLKVSDLHSIYYALFGNPQGKPVFVLHGGPGCGCYPRLVQYFDPEKFLIVLHDQRGAGRSTPAGELRENTTQDLIADIERLRKHLEIDGKVMVFGGSWGSTLGLAYAETHPEHVSGMVIRGVWTGTQEEIDNAYAGERVRAFFPKAVAEMEAAMPPGIEFHPKTLEKIFTGDDDALMLEVAKAEMRFWTKISRLHAREADLEESDADYDPRVDARIDTHYANHRCFLEEGQLLRDAHKLKDIPIAIINGRYDMLCPPITAWRLQQALPASTLIIVEEAGHVESEPRTTWALVEAVAAFE